MRKFVIAILSLGCMSGAAANWEPGGGFTDDGTRVTIGFRGGVARPVTATMQNDLGAFFVGYSGNGEGYFPNDNCSGLPGACLPMGIVDLGRLPVAKEFDSNSFTGGMSVGMRLGGKPNIRAEIDWTRISEANFNARPLFSDNILMMYPVLDGGNLVSAPSVVTFHVGGARTSVSTDIISAMVYYDFFDGVRKPLGTMIPYVGLGFGYGISTTVLQLSDPYADLSGDLQMQDFGTCRTVQGITICDFYTSETDTNNFVLAGAVGFSYGIERGIFFDLGARAVYIPRISWALNNGLVANVPNSTTTSKERDIFSANNVVYMSIYAGLRFEF